MPPDRSRIRSTRARASSSVVQSTNRAGETAGGALGQPADLGDPAHHLRAGQVPAGAGLGALAELEVQRLHPVEVHLVPAEPARRQLVEVAGALGLLLGQHAALAGADRGARPLGAARERDLRLRRQRAEAHVGHEHRDVEAQRAGGGRADRHRRVDGFVVQPREAVQLRGEDLQVVPLRELVAGHTHGGDGAVRAGQPVLGQPVDLRDVRLLRAVLVRVVEQPVVGGRDAPFRPHRAVLDELVLVQQHLAVDDVAAEFVDPLGRVVGGDAGVEPVVPAVHAADQVGALDPAVGQQRAPVRAAALEHVHRGTAAYEHEVDAVGLRVGGCVVGQRVEAGDRDQARGHLQRSEGRGNTVRPPSAERCGRRYTSSRAVTKPAPMRTAPT